MKKLLCLLLASLMLLSVVACATGDNTDESVSATESQSESTSEVDTNYVCDLPSDLNYGDEVVYILYTDAAGRNDELVDDGTGSVVSEAVHTRNVLVEDQLGVRFEMTSKPDSTQVVTAHKQDVNANTNEFDLISNGTYLSVQPAIEGYYVDLNSLEYINTDKHYWTQGYNDMVTFTENDMQFLASGSIAISMFRYTYLTIYNKQLFQDYQETDLYEVVKAGDWTLDYQYSVLSGKYLEKDGDGKPSKDDFYGFVTGDTISVDPYMVATDTHLIIKDKETRNMSFNSEAQQKLSNVCDAVQKLYNDQGTYVYKSSTMDDVHHNFIISHFNNELAMMATTTFLQMELNFEDLAALTYGIAPIPKFSKEQSSHYSYVQDQVTCFGITNGVDSSERKNMLSAVLEAMAYHSNNTVRPAYYETALSERYMQDPQSSEVLDMMFNSLYFDFSSSCSNIFTSCVLRDNLRPLLSGKTNTIGSSTKGWQVQINKALERRIQPQLDKLLEQN